MELVKVLSSNDVGSTGGHQSGVVIPKSVTSGDFFPALDPLMINPRETLKAVLEESGRTINLNFIYYNGRLHGTSTRNEYRLTGISPFLKDVGAQEGDRLVFTRVGPKQFLLRLEFGGSLAAEGKIVVTLSKDWTMRRLQD
jgi:hypothetical protein